MPDHPMTSGGAVPFCLLKISPEDRGTAAADFRLEDGKVAEHRDVLRPVPEGRERQLGVLTGTR